MKDIFTNYIKSISAKFLHKETSEMGYRTDFEIFIKGIFDQIKVKRIDHDPKAKKGNKPDFVVIIYDVPILYIETKNIGVTLDKIESSKQMIRYFGYTNLVLTDYVEFRFYRNGLTYEEPIKIADYDLKNRTISPLPDNYEHLAKTLIDFTKSHKEPIKSGEHLAKIMAGKAQRIRDNAKFFLSNRSEKNTEITRIYEIIRKLLVHDLTKNSFADMYAQTVVYGLFVARYYDKTPESFTRQEARDLVPASNPFLRHFFDHIVGPDFDKRLEYIVNELCVVFSHSNVSELMKQYFKSDIWGKSHAGPDPVIHFYEDFLNEYDPELRKKLGAYYTPLPVVRFIIRSVNYLLKKDFGLCSGLADTSKLPSGIHRVQILDPAVGTGTFISEVIGTIYKWICKSKQKGRWPTYVHHDLLPRLHGFEIMMAPYTIAHLKLSIAFGKTGFKYFNKRLGIYLTNSLEGWPIQDDMFPGFGFAESIAEESKKASVVKNKTPIMVVVGNPPYSVSSSNKGEWIQNLIKVYKIGLKEKNIQPLSDDYIKFIRFAEHFIEKNKTGIVAMITNNSFLDGIIHRQMRSHLLEVFNEIYVLNLHGNSKKKETSPDGGKDENVFNITQGVSISILIRKDVDRKDRAAVYHTDLFGKREIKFDTLDKFDIDTIQWKKLKCVKPYYFFVPKDFGNEIEYKKGFQIDNIFNVTTSGIKTHHDKELVNFDPFEENNQPYLYRPFDIRNIDYNLKKVVRHRYSKMKHMLYKNLSLLTCRNQNFLTLAFVSKNLSDIRAFSCPGSIGTDYALPLYLYSDDGSRMHNLNQDIIQKIDKIVGRFLPEDIFSYIYAVLYSPKYREKYKEFLKIEFPCIPYPKDKKSLLIITSTLAMFPNRPGISILVVINQHKNG
jgi:type I restriction-modification system DNA methylase subunit